MQTCSSVQGQKNQAHFVDISLLAAQEGAVLCKALPGLHALTGCDSTSAFVGRGKKPALSLLGYPASHGARQALSSLGDSVSDSIVKQLEKFVCQLYGSVQHSSVNEFEQVLFEEFS